jgi:ABC-type uncharacterized transport system auxiliary subunit
MPVRILIFLMLAMPVISACSGLLESEQPARQYWMLSPVTDLEPPSRPVVLDLSAVPGLDTDRVQALAHDAALHRYANARWADNLPEVLDSVLTRSLDNPDASGAAWRLELQVHEFFGRMNSAQQTTSVSVSVAGTVQCQETRHRLNAHASPEVRSENLSAIVAAHQAGLDDVTRQLVRQLEAHCG